jgi:hypothetical protein
MFIFLLFGSSIVFGSKLARGVPDAPLMAARAPAIGEPNHSSRKMFASIWK